LQVLRLDHVNVRTVLFAETMAFYTEILRLKRYDSASGAARAQNAWLGDDQGEVMIHLNGATADEASSLTRLPNSLDHFALRCVGLRQFRDHLAANDVPFEHRRLPDRAMDQLIIYDPNGVKIELSFVDEPTG
jgi:catechol 2,3-dioxygenase-like lactoylglutathione lyase family enzyme